ncbi:hypothetical protein PAAG_11905 [Paracoccidioides lutzii Pb01]|uniref:Uncharacterized protein n=1 Tax=Paracoccidioides lutzii (strain ATCC MYA-826 / Pb01) TaxID=502779 RepID=A0A0A2V1Q1_PARBA|nr:hypothetical protein PAAG_11905 [Paracoccidioides lutzii Pb01]KGQ01438.1 hypothetical protein PAAG_11905 [Paracoccidioides lutzii Pb01]
MKFQSNQAGSNAFKIVIIWVYPRKNGRTQAKPTKQGRRETDIYLSPTQPPTPDRGGNNDVHGTPLDPVWQASPPASSKRGFKEGMTQPAEKGSLSSSSDSSIVPAAQNMQDGVHIPQFR